MGYICEQGHHPSVAGPCMVLVEYMSPGDPGRKRDPEMLRETAEQIEEIKGRIERKKKFLAVQYDSDISEGLIALERELSHVQRRHKAAQGWDPIQPSKRIGRCGARVRHTNETINRIFGS